MVITTLSLHRHCRKAFRVIFHNTTKHRVPFKLKSWGYEVELANGIELDFDSV